MSVAVRLIAFVVGLLAVFAGAVGVGTLVPNVMDSPASGENGYTLALMEDELPDDDRAPFRMSILGPDGEPVTDYTETHDKDLHLIVVRRDMTGYQHVHPTLDADGVWSQPLALTPGQWKVFADFTPAEEEENLILGADLAVPGAYKPRPLPLPKPVAEVDRYTVSLDGGLVPGKESKLTMTVARNGKPVTDLQPYLAAYGHLVALRDGDLAYLHVHPAHTPRNGTTPSGPEITFEATAPSIGDYRLFLDFRHQNTVRTAEFTVSAGAGGQRPGSGHDDTGGDAGHDH